ncbi:MAG: Asp-tRNA(Asn)/Glu-tRNA(Gln) amidotransferase GatCAB subunit A [Nitrospiraceae bacterium]|nr:Asp-tRNA(Asn)/Glu-tRNA(Gln) amidotransferase GatCAB subunit A [Nitrospiraceae bacterium]
MGHGYSRGQFTHLDHWNAQVNLNHLTIHDAADGLANAAFSSQELSEAVHRQITRVDDTVHAYHTVLTETSKTTSHPAKANSLLQGIPLGIKDNICTEDVVTTCGSRMLEHFIPPYNATVMTCLEGHGAVLVGKTNMDEFAMGSSTEHSAFQPTRNPWDLERIPGGSSGGSAAAVAAHECIAALGSDTGGSIRQPAACCGVVGMKPTYGRVSRYGLISYASSLDQIGPLTKDVTDAAIMLEAIAGHDPKDSTSVTTPVPTIAKALHRDMTEIRIGIPDDYFADGLDPEVNDGVRAALKVLTSRGAKTKAVSLPTTPYGIATYYLIATAEASSNLARYDGVKYGHRSSQSQDLLEMYCQTRKEGFGRETKRRIMLGTYALSAGYYDAYYGKAQQARKMIRADFEAAFQEVDVIVTPTTPTPAFRIGEKTADPVQMYLSDIYTISANLGGFPAISVPCAMSRDGLPIGMQILGRWFDELTMLQVAFAFEQETDWHLKRAPISEDSNG